MAVAVQVLRYSLLGSRLLPKISYALPCSGVTYDEAGREAPKLSTAAGSVLGLKVKNFMTISFEKRVLFVLIHVVVEVIALGRDDRIAK